jgi:protein-tyrosine phosphatase
MREFERLVSTLLALEPSTVESLRSAQGMSGAAKIAEFVRLAGGMRGYETRRPSPEDDDIVDPFRMPQAVYDTAGELINESVSLTAAALGSLCGPDRSRDPR